ncbi:cell division FtsA domain-containing protein [Roseburia sp. 831b]|uniref:cell division FtsA domain-containing protein n=1 Tax=Roseburia sp. 831b TaxID=1261635 RepID=UPI0009511042|nr:cell division FtsA domain-containing protein [Roseburia sp. 831b]WVK73504.1 cell division FtsA domain-containing protein [Roseburia sp. 831b]
MNDAKELEQQLVFGLDIGTRNVVGTVGYKDGDQFIVVAQYVKQHETRSMLDGQIHDIGRVGKTIEAVKKQLEEQTGVTLSEVCIAAAGRVLKTVTTSVAFEYEEESVVTGEDIHTLDLLGIEHAQEILKEKNDTKYKFYCVGYSVVKYYLNDEVFSNLEGHKATTISEDVIVTFLPEDVVDGLYAAVGMAGLSVANLTLEPIAAINVAIPENYRLLNIGLVDVGAGTSDISITKDGSIVAYGMIPFAGDEITELIVQNYLVDFKTAEHIKLASGTDSQVTYEDIMSITHTIPSEDVWKLTEPVVDKITTDVADKIKELNGDQAVSATFVVGGGGKIHGFTEMLAEKLGLPSERVALRGEEVLQEVVFEQEDIKKDPLLVTPIGICLNYYDQRNNFIMVRFNGERIRLYDNNKLTIVDAALQAGFPNDELFPKRGKEINFTVNGVARIARGEAGESAIVTMNDKIVSINTPLEPNSEIVIEPSTCGEDAHCTIEDLGEYTQSTIIFQVNDKKIRCPKFVEVNGSLEPPNYQIQENDVIETRSFYTVGQVAEFMDVELDPDKEIFVNNRLADKNTLVYENFTIEWSVLSFASASATGKKIEYVEDDKEDVAIPFSESIRSYEQNLEQEQSTERGWNEEENLSQEQSESKEQDFAQEENRNTENGVANPNDFAEETTQVQQECEDAPEDTFKAEETTNVVEDKTPQGAKLSVWINNEPFEMSGKKEYIFVDIFNFYPFDLTASRGRAIVTKINGQNAQFAEPLNEGDRIEIYWKEN